jgi:hypothetical protein
VKNILGIMILSLFCSNLSFALSSEKINRLKFKAKNNTSKLAIQNYCSKEDAGLDVDSDIAEQMLFSKSCKCAIKAGKTNDELMAKDILNYCGL